MSAYAKKNTLNRKEPYDFLCQSLEFRFRSSVHRLKFQFGISINFFCRQ